MKKEVSKETGIKLTKEELCEILIQTLLIQECRDSDIRDAILDQYENEDYYGVLVGVYDEISSRYFKLGFETYQLITGTRG